VNNDNGVVIGVLVGDGVALAYSSAVTGETTLCLAKRNLGHTIDSIYTVLDFASSDGNFTTLTPLELNVTEEAGLIGRNNSRLCATLPTSESSSYFPIIRIANWRERRLADDPSVR
jgi:hypothetical protein